MTCQETIFVHSVLYLAIMSYFDHFTQWTKFNQKIIWSILTTVYLGEKSEHLEMKWLK